jgi:hypothetical protein
VSRVHGLLVWGVNLYMGRASYPLSSSFKKPSWYELALMDALEKDEALKSTLRERRISKNFSNFMALICSINDSMTSSVRE